MLSWPIPKDPDEILDYQFDWSARLEPGETIDTSVFLVLGSVDVSDEDVSGALTTFWAAGGTPGEACRITNRIGTNQNRVYDQTATLRIRER